MIETCTGHHMELWEAIAKDWGRSVSEWNTVFRAEYSIVHFRGHFEEEASAKPFFVKMMFYLQDG